MSIKKGKYQHYKGQFYELIDIVRHSETEEELVLYKPLYKSDSGKASNLWVRPKTMFFEQVNINGIMRPRFAYVG
ncbi:DUF1653 domain-containing protein [Glaciecola siphonariae]|uniref:DUF1653 domain-containing protein n=1 Tax=Glaciecola siphonariae TaxID=521012 RepID=A0ABV9LYL8_9ALTE